MSSSTPASSAIGSRSTPFPERGAGNGECVDAIRLAPIAAAAPLAGHQPRRDTDDPLAMDEQEAFEGAGDVAAVLQRPHPLVLALARPSERRGKPAITDL